MVVLPAEAGEKNISALRNVCELVNHWLLQRAAKNRYCVYKLPLHALTHDKRIKKERKNDEMPVNGIVLDKDNMPPFWRIEILCSTSWSENPK